MNPLRWRIVRAVSRLTGQPVTDLVASLESSVTFDLYDRYL